MTDQFDARREAEAMYNLATANIWNGTIDAAYIDELTHYFKRAHDAGLSEGALIGHMQQAAELNELRRKAREMRRAAAAVVIAYDDMPSGDNVFDAIGTLEMALGVEDLYGKARIRALADVLGE